MPAGPDPELVVVWLTARKALPVTGARVPQISRAWRNGEGGGEPFFLSAQEEFLTDTALSVPPPVAPPVWGALRWQPAQTRKGRLSHSCICDLRLASRCRRAPAEK